MLSAARCNLFSYSLAAYQTNWITTSEKNLEALEAHIKLIEQEPKSFHQFTGVLKELAQDNSNEEENKNPPVEPLKLNDNDQKLFFGDEFSDEAIEKEKDEIKKVSNDEKLISYDDGFDEFMSASSSSNFLPSQLLLDDSFYNQPTNIDLLGSLIPSQTNNDLLASSSSPLLSSKEEATKDFSENSLNKNPSKKANDVSKWFQLFSELDPLNQSKEVKDASENMHAA